MHPILFQIGPLTLRTYGVLIAFAFLAALQVGKRAIRLRGMNARILNEPVPFYVKRWHWGDKEIWGSIFDNLAFVLVFSGLVGARLFYVLLNGSYYLQHPWESLMVWEGGLVFYGGFLFAAGAAIIFLRRQLVPAAAMADCLAPALAVGQAVGRWGCFFAGCCYGTPTALPWAVTFRDSASLAPLNVSLHPVQIYESLGNLAIAAVLWRRLNGKKPIPPGQVFWLYVLLYGLLRFGVEFLRGDDRGPVFGGLFPSQVIALAAILLSGSILMAQTVDSGERYGALVENREPR